MQTAATAHSGSIVTAGPAVEGTGGPGGLRAGFAGGAPPIGAGGLPSGELPGDIRGGPMGAGGPGEAAETDPALVALLRTATTRWAAATVGAQGAAGMELSSGTAVMAIGGFTGGDPAPNQFQSSVAAGEIHWFVGSAGNGRGGTGSEIAEWVAATYPATTVGGTTVYDLTAGWVSTRRPMCRDPG